jgi:hypothetical protein
VVPRAPSSRRPPASQTLPLVHQERIGPVSLAVPAAELTETVGGIARDCLAVPVEGALMNKGTLNTALEVLGVGALFRYHGQMNALGRLRERSGDDGFGRFR